MSARQPARKRVRKAGAVKAAPKAVIASAPAAAPTYTADEMMTVVAARLLQPGHVCFVGIGTPSAAANLARLTHAPDIVLIYESGTIGVAPHVLPLSIGDGELAETATALVPLPEVFAYWLQAGRVDVGFLGAAQIDRYGNLNTTVVGDYDHPVARLPGAGGAPEIARHAKQTFVVLRQTPRSFVAELDFVTTPGFLSGHGERARRGLEGAGPQVVVTDLGLLRPDPQSQELTLVALYPGVEAEQASLATGWPLAIADTVETLAPPSEGELRVLRELQRRTRDAHAQRPPFPPRTVTKT
jgi:glutaconate CoA-transferase subunit B